MLLSKTVVGLFKDRSEVDSVLADLRKEGISKDSIKVVDQHELESDERLVGEEASRGEGIKGLLKRLFGTQSFMDFEHGSLHRDWIRNGGFLVAVNTDDSHSARVNEIMEGYDPDAIKRMTKTEVTSESKRGTETLRAVSSQRSETIERATGIIGRDGREEETIPVIQEEMHVGKRKVRRSSIRVIKHVTETPVEETIRLRDETVTIDRRPVDRIVGEGDIAAFADSQVEMIETTEEPVVSKETHVIEEIRITKNVVDHEEKIRDKVRRTDIDIEGFGPERLRELGFKKDFSARFAKSGGNYSEFAPAYEFGSTLASDERYRNRDWASMETETRRQWEAKGRSWKDFGEAIRHGWESTRRHVA